MTISVLLTLATVGAIVHMLDITKLVRSWSSLSWIWTLPALIIYLSNLMLRALRLGKLFGRDLISFRSGLRISCYFSLLNFLVPARLGEVSLPWMVASHTGIQFSAAAWVMLFVRVLELTIAFFLLLLVLVAYPNELQPMLTYSGWTQKIVILSLAVAIGITLFILVKWQKKLGFNYFDQTLVTSLGVVVLAFLQTLVICMFLKIESPLQVAPMIFFASLFLRFIPVSGLANTGGLHLAWALPLFIVGYTQAEALELSVWAHLLITSLTLLMGFSGYLLFRGRD